MNSGSLFSRCQFSFSDCGGAAALMDASCVVLSTRATSCCEVSSTGLPSRCSSSRFFWSSSAAMPPPYIQSRRSCFLRGASAGR